MGRRRGGWSVVCTRDEVEDRVDDTGGEMIEVVLAHEEDETDADEGEDGHVEEDTDDGEQPEGERKLENISQCHVLATGRLQHTTHYYIDLFHALLSLRDL